MAEYNFRREGTSTTAGDIVDQLPAGVPFFDDTPTGHVDEVLDAPSEGNYVGWEYDPTSSPAKWSEPEVPTFTNQEKVRSLKSVIGQRVRELDSQQNSEWPGLVATAAVDRVHNLGWTVDRVVALDAPEDSDVVAFEEALEELELGISEWYGRVNGQTNSVQNSWSTKLGAGEVRKTEADGSVGDKIDTVEVAGVTTPNVTQVRAETWRAWTEICSW